MSIPPPATIGIIGGGQLGRMLAIEAKKLGYYVRIFDPQRNAPAAQVADEAYIGHFDDLELIQKFAQGCHVITYEFENISTRPLCDLVEKGVRVSPSPDVLAIAQNREKEKNFLKSNGFPCADFLILNNVTELSIAANNFPFPACLKSSEFGYDGKGQVRLEKEFDAVEAWKKMGGKKGILERWIDFSAELSVICARWQDGRTVAFGAIENLHRNHILDTSISPGRFSPEIAQKAENLAIEIAHHLRVVGLLTVEMFLEPSGKLLVNELAPRPHNSGHFTFDACFCSQFEQHIRAICNLPPGSVEQFRPAVMVNLLGDFWHQEKSPNWIELLNEPCLKLHLYGKDQPRTGRKMGHFTILGYNLDHAIKKTNTARKILGLPSIT
ncbi:MAG: 5-(carboxyamino)imidazole ribonucleotide synthase [Chthoniobacterales bacterium]|nr:5-(carboxyamino)imidazole ribonucleotide synthase [Chthoniobacterales bacterium]